MSERKSLKNKAMLVNLSIGQWSMRKYDRRISNEVNEHYNADYDASRVNKVLIAIDQAKIISKAVNESRIFHYANTLPWTDEGRRILPTANFFDYVNELNAMKHKFWRVVESFWNNYETYKYDAKKILGGLFKEADYPDLDHLRNKYKFSIDFLPIPDTQDFRVDLTGVEMDRIKLELETSLKNAEREAMKDLWNRLHGAIKHIINRLSEKDAIFRDSLIGNVIELSDLLPRLNFTDDPDLEAMRQEINQSICTISPESIRNDAKLRQATAHKAADIIKKMEGYMGYTPAEADPNLLDTLDQTK